MFLDPTNQLRWICPNITKIYMNQYYGLAARIVKCGKATGDIYANDVPCDETKIQSLEVRSNAVSSHFDPMLAHAKSGALQLYNTVQEVKFKPSQTSARQVMSASQQVNTFKDDFFFPGEQTEIITTAIDSKDFSGRGKNYYYYASIYLRAAAKQSATTWYRIYFTDFVSNIAALALSAMSACHILLKYQHIFT